MRLLTKADRDNSRKVQFESLIKNGYLQETYKGLDIFTNNDGKFFTLKAFRGTSSNHIQYINYRSDEKESGSYCKP